MLAVNITTFGNPPNQVTASNGCNAPVVAGTLVVHGTVAPVTAGPKVQCWVHVNNMDFPPAHAGATPDPKTGEWSVSIGGLAPYVGMAADVKATATNSVPENANTSVSVNLVNA